MKKNGKRPLVRKPEPPKIGRPPLDIDPAQVEQLAMIDCSYAEMAAVLGCDASTLTRRFAQVIEKGREAGKSSLKRAQFKAAINGNPTMLIWLGKQRLGQADQQHLKIGRLDEMSNDQLKALADGKQMGE